MYVTSPRHHDKNIPEILFSVEEAARKGKGNGTSEFKIILTILIFSPDPCSPDNQRVEIQESLWPDWRVYWVSSLRWWRGVAHLSKHSYQTETPGQAKAVPGMTAGPVNSLVRQRMTAIGEI